MVVNISVGVSEKESRATVKYGSWRQLETPRNDRRFNRYEVVGPNYLATYGHTRRGSVPLVLSYGASNASELARVDGCTAGDVPTLPGHTAGIGCGCFAP